MELVSFALGGVGLIVVGGHEAFLYGSQTGNNKKSPSQIFWICVAILASLFVLNTTVSLLDAHKSNDAVGSALQLQVIPIAFIFLFYSVLPLLHLTIPSTLVDLVAAFAFAQEFLLFYLQRKDPYGVENRYYDLLLVPIALCFFCTLLDLISPNSHSSFPKLGRGLGLILHGTWLLQMGLSLFSGWVAHGCSLHLVSRGNYTLKCNGHPEYHRARALATLQFNCHLALLLLFLVPSFSLLSATNRLPLHSISTPYAPLGTELHLFDNNNNNNSPNFTLDSDDDNDDTHEAKVLVVEHAINGNASHH